MYAYTAVCGRKDKTLLLGEDQRTQVNYKNLPLNIMEYEIEVVVHE